MPKQPLAEVFGYPISNVSRHATLVREETLCPYNNKVPECTKNSKKNPLGVCSTFDAGKPTIICPIRFREDWLIERDAAEFFFGKGAKYRRLSEIRLNDASGKSAGNIDHVLVQLDEDDEIVDFGSLEVQGVYISGNISAPFHAFMNLPEKNKPSFDWSDEESYPHADFLSSTRKRLAPQLIFKGGILKKWGKKSAVAVDEVLWATLPRLKKVKPDDADMAWLIYKLEHDKTENRYRLVLAETFYTDFDDTVSRITKTEAGDVGKFVKALKKKINMLESATDDPDPTVDTEHDVA